VRKTEMFDKEQRSIPLSIILLLATAVHAPLLLMKLPLKSYDGNFHVFFASHYLHHWFDPWNPKWYAGFSQTTYPPLPQQWIAMISPLFGLEFGYMVVQFAAILLLVVGVYRFSMLWVGPRAASFAAIATVFLGAESFLVYSAGQLGTTSAAPLYLNALPFMFDWVRFGSGRAFIKATVLFAAAAAAHHATLLFGSFLFAIPVLALAFLDETNGEQPSISIFVARIISMAVVVGAAIAAVLLPFWIALIHYPVTQTPIPHPSRANYILSPEWGVNYFVVPYGALILALPFILYRGSMTARLRPLLFGFWVAFMLGLGGTTPVGPILLRRAFDVLTMERFSYWAGLLALPFVGLFAAELFERFRIRAAVALSTLAACTLALAVAWAALRPAEGGTQTFNVDAIAQWLNRDGHDQYRYITLGFGNQISHLARLTNANSVDGEWNSGRMLPELTQFGGGSLSNSKYFNKAGFDALRAMLMHADHYGLKWVIVHDPYYDPLLSFAGWRPVDSLDEKALVVWSKDGVPPAVPLNVPQIPPHWQGLLWGTLPFGSSILAILVVLIPEKRRRTATRKYQVETEEELVHGRIAS
jgi:hypothetical protein